jgi:hypothetical protein
MREYIGLAAGLIGVVGYVPYVWDILNGTARPDRASWFIWSLQYVLLFWTQVSGHAASVLWLPGLQLLGVLVVAALSVRYGMGVFDKRTALLLAGVVVALGLWYVTKNATVALCISLSIEAVGVALTAYKAFKDPASETLTMWSCVAVGALLDTVAIARGASAALYVYPVALAVMNMSVVFAQLLGRRKLQVMAASVTSDGM